MNHIRFHFTLMAATLLLVSTSLRAAHPDSLWFAPTDRFKLPTLISLANVDSIRFNFTNMLLYSTDANGNLKRTNKTYTLTGQYQFERPGLTIYKPDEIKNMNFDDENSRWCWARSRESEHFICLWEKGFGRNPKTSNISLDVDLVLKRAEQLFAYYADSLGFIVRGNSRSTDRYKLIIMVNYSTDWLATGSGYDNIIGALWCTPWALDASGGHTIAHEVGHSFQYLVGCDLGTTHGWRWGFGDGGSGGCAWWESCAQWQGFKVYPEQQFSNGYTTESINSAHKNLLHESWRYANYFIQDYWCQLHGLKFIGELWRASTSPEDPVETYKRITGTSQSQFNDEIFDFARRSATYDIDGIRERGASHQDAYSTRLDNAGTTEDGRTLWRVNPASCPENYGFNIIRVNRAEPGTTVTARFRGFTGGEGFRKVRTAQAGWRYGFCAQTSDGNRVYGDICSEREGEATFVVPEGVQRMWFVVSGAPTSHFRHPWDDNDSNDEQWPYEVSFLNTDRYGQFAEYPADYEGCDTTVVINTELAYDGGGYSSVRVQYDLEAVSLALGLSSQQLAKVRVGNATTSPAFVGIDSNGKTLHYNTTTSTSNNERFGHWFNNSGNVCNYDGSARIFAEFYPDSYACYVGQYPARLQRGKTYVVRQGIRAKSPAGKWHIAIFEVHLKVI